jgi:hypothetical protein
VVALSRPCRKKSTPRRSPSASPRSASSGRKASTTDQQDAHRLAVIEIDNGGSVGSALALFEEAAAKVAERTRPPSLLAPDAMRAEAALIRHEIEEAIILAEAATALRDAELEAAAIRRRLHRTIAAEGRRLDRERRRSKGGLYAGQPRAENRPTRLAVDPEAWEVLKGDAIRRRTSVVPRGSARKRRCPPQQAPARA